MKENEEASVRQKVITRLETYLCLLNSKKRMSQTSPEENHQIALLIQNREAAFPDPEGLMELVVPKELKVYL